jgi:DNA-binding GntR family transcriptional regulator
MKGQAVESALGAELIADRAYEELRGRIVTLHLPPGSLLREDELMRELKIGRTPLREAVKRLAHENLVAVRPRRATVVTEVDKADIVHVAEVRAELEAHAAELAARRLDDAGRGRARALLAALDGLGTSDAEALMQLDERVHRFIYDAAANPYLAATLERYFTLSLRIWHLVLDKVPSLGGAVREQRLLLEAVLAGDSARARELMRDHVLDFERAVLKAFD